MTQDLSDDVEEFEAKLGATPGSESALGRLLFAYLGHPELHADPRRIAHIREYVRRFPREATCRTPAVAVDPEKSPDGFRTIEEEWAQLLAEHPNDPSIAIGVALFLAAKDRRRAMDVLRVVLAAEPELGEVWFELGRISEVPVERLENFKKARSLGASNPNLPAWVATLAAEVGDWTTAYAVAQELLDAVDEARSIYGNELDWPESGRALWRRAVSVHPYHDDATRVVRAISAHADNKHWGHTVKGLISLHQGDIAAATDHLRRSGQVVGNARLSSYGPATVLAAALCEYGRWSDVAAYLDACGAFWPDERLRRWRDQVDRHELPALSNG